MFLNICIHFALGLIASFIGGIPFGLVNLAIVDVSVNKSSKESFNIAVGATSVETVFAFISLFLGGIITNFVDSNPMVRSILFVVILIAGIMFIIKKEKLEIRKNETKSKGFTKGALLMMVSFQVILLWIGVAAFYKSKGLIKTNPISVVFFLPGVFIGKMMAYYLYNRLSIYNKNSLKIWLIKFRY